MEVWQLNFKYCYNLNNCESWRRMSEYRQQNIDRFLGFADLYHQYRPKAPTLIADILIQYLGRRPQCVVDVGCGTGLSTFLWENRADRVLGVEPNASM